MLELYNWSDTHIEGDITKEDCYDLVDWFASQLKVSDEEIVDLKKRKEELFKVIADANSKLEQLRKECKHEETYKGIWMWAPGHTFNALICDICGECVKNLDMEGMVIKEGTKEIKSICSSKLTQSIPFECRKCGHRNTENCNTCDILNPQFR